MGSASLKCPSVADSLQLGALNDYLLPAVLDEPRNRPCAPRTPREPKQRQAAGRRKLAEPGSGAGCQLKGC